MYLQMLSADTGPVHCVETIYVPYVSDGRMSSHCHRHVEEGEHSTNEIV